MDLDVSGLAVGQRKMNCDEHHVSIPRIIANTRQTTLCYKPVIFRTSLLGCLTELDDQYHAPSHTTDAVVETKFGLCQLCRSRRTRAESVGQQRGPFEI